MNEAEQWFDDANGELALGELERAAELYRRCVEIQPDYFDAWHALGMCLMKLERTGEAVDALKEAVRLGPEDQMAYTSLSIAYGRNNQIQEAEEMAAKARIISWGGKAGALDEEKRA